MLKFYICWDNLSNDEFLKQMLKAVFGENTELIKYKKINYISRSKVPAQPHNALAIYDPLVFFYRSIIDKCRLLIIDSWVKTNKIEDTLVYGDILGFNTGAITTDAVLTMLQTKLITGKDTKPVPVEYQTFINNLKLPDYKGIPFDSLVSKGIKGLLAARLNNTAENEGQLLFAYDINISKNRIEVGLI